MLKLAFAAAPLLVCACRAEPDLDLHVGDVENGAVLLPTSQSVRPVGDVLRFAGRPVDLALAADGRFAFVKEAGALVLVDTASWSVVQRLSFGEDQGASVHGLAVSRDGRHVFVTDTKRGLREARFGANGELVWARTIDMPLPAIGGEPYPCGIALSAAQDRALVCLSRSNSVAIVDLAAGSVTAEVPVGVAPFDVAIAPDGRTAYVSNFGGRRAAQGEVTAKSSGTDIAVDAHGVASSGTVTRIDLATQSGGASIECGLHPSDIELAADGSRLYVAAANSDAVFAVDTATFTVAEKISVKLDEHLPFGCIVNALSISPDGTHLYAANGGNNALAVVRLGREGRASTVEGFIPTDWFPGAIVCRGEHVFVACVHGDGSREPKTAGKWHSNQVRGSLARVHAPDETALAAWSAQAREDARVPAALRALDRARTGVAARPVPRRAGEPSVFEHVVYVIKENRTYDQMLGDIGRGNSDPALCIFGRDVTPNHHALAESFVLLDNYYCNGVVSADGHQWATQGVAVDYIEKQFGGWTRCYDLGTDALTYAASNFLWDSALLSGLSFRNYGEFDFPRLTAPKGGWFDVYRDWTSGAREFACTHSIQVEALRRYSAPEYPGWELKITDQLRMDRFLDEFRASERTGEWPNLVIVYLPQDHTSGTSAKAPSPRAHVADNDLALGRLVDAISHSRFWPSTCIFVNEDDPQNGFDHVDGHRSLCLVASPYTRRGAVISHFYDQTSVLHTIEKILGLPPLTQLDALAPTMDDCFTAKPDFAPYDRLANRIALDEPNPKPASALLDSEARRFAAMCESSDLSLPDRIDDDAWNRALWFAAKGPAIPYPAAFAGAHGRGLNALALRLEGGADDDDDD
jgi:YVTN family beta-propeller protein